MRAYLVALTLGVGLLIGQVVEAQTTITNAQDAVAIVAAGSAGTAYTFTCVSGSTCTHRITNTIVPKNGDTFTATAPGRITLSGAVSLPNTVGMVGGDWTFSGVYWYIAESARSDDHGHTGTSTDCDSGILRCKYPEDVTIDGVEKRHVASTAALTAGTFFYDYTIDRLYIGDNPAGHTIELSVAENAFKSSATNVTISNLIIEKFAVIVQHGAIEDLGSGWNVHHNEIRYNHGRGITIGTSEHLFRNYIHHNYQMGVGGGGTNSTVEYNEIAYNRSAVVGISIGWEAGGTKFAFTMGLVVRVNNVHHNDGIGLWTDISNRNGEYSGNTVDDNTWAGIMHEISFNWVIRDNLIRRNGLTQPNVGLASKQCFVPDAAIFIADSSNVHIYGNFIEGNADGICGVQQDRSSDETFFGEPAGSYRIRGLDVHDNTIAPVATTNTQLAGISADYKATEIADLTGTYAGSEDPTEVRQPAGTGYNNHFECNRYYLGTAGGADSWWLFTSYATFSQWQALGHDTGSTTRCVATSGSVGSYATIASYTAFVPPAYYPHLRLVH